MTEQKIKQKAHSRDEPLSMWFSDNYLALEKLWQRLEEERMLREYGVNGFVPAWAVAHPKPE
jgi:hypothetical protein